MPNVAQITPKWNETKWKFHSYGKELKTMGAQAFEEATNIDVFASWYLSVESSIDCMLPPHFPKTKGFCIVFSDNIAYNIAMQKLKDRGFTPKYANTFVPIQVLGVPWTFSIIFEVIAKVESFSKN